MTELITAINATTSAVPVSATTATKVTGDQSSELGSRFVDWLSNEVSVINNQINTAELDLREFAAGKTDNLHQVMLSLNKAKLSFELMVEVRNKALEGYQEIMRMQI